MKAGPAAVGWAIAALALAGCAPVTPLQGAAAVDAAPVMEKATVFLDFVAENLPRNLSGQILPLQMILFEIDPQTGERTPAPSWSLGLCVSQAFGCETGEIKTLKLQLPPGSYAIGYLGSTAFAAPWYSLMAFDDPTIRGGDVVVAGLTVTPSFSTKGHVTPRTPILTVRAGEVGYAGVLRAVYAKADLITTVAAAPERRADLAAQTGQPIADRPVYYR